MSPRKNILFIIIDQLRADCLTGALADHVALPNLRALMADGTSFARHFSVTNPCGPSRVSILTGQYAMNHGSVRNGTPLARDTPNLATEARKVGYLPLLFGYTDTAQDPRGLAPDDPALRSYEQVMEGFEEVVEMRMEESWPWRADLLSKGYDVPDYPDNFRPDGTRPDDPAQYRAEDSDTAFLTDATINALRARKPGWFAHLTYLRPHPPLVAPAPYNRMYDPESLPLPVRCGDAAAERARHPFIGPAHERTGIAAFVEGFTDLEPSDENTRMLRALYLGLATEVDHHLGRLIGFLKDSGQYDDTLIVVTADHGEMLGDHHAWGKMSFYDAAYHTPLIIRAPGVAARGVRVTVPTESVDLAPTILDWIGQPAPDSMNGRSLLPLLSGQVPGGWRDHSYSELDFGDPVSPTIWQERLGLGSDVTNLAILRGPRHTLVHFNAGLPPVLFDHQGEGELRDIAGEPEAQPLLLAMTRRLLDHRMTHAGGLFARTMITSNGVRTGTRKPT